MNINELEELAKEWDRFDADNEYSQSFLELIAAYREAVAALVHIQRCIPINGFAQIHHESQTWEQIDASLDTAKRLGVE